jgi:hypothetical protein
MKKFLMIAALASLSSVAAFASPACATGSDSTPTLGNSFTLTGSCTVGSFIFSNFSIYEANGTYVNAPFSVNIVVDPAFGIDILYTGEPGLDLHLTFQSTPGIPGIILETGLGSTVSEGICGTAFNLQNGTSACGGNLLNTSVLTASNGGTKYSVVTAASTDFFFKDISGGSEVTQLVAPEPMTLSLMGIGLLGIGIFGRRRFTK